MAGECWGVNTLGLSPPHQNMQVPTWVHPCVMVADVLEAGVVLGGWGEIPSGSSYLEVSY